MFEHSKMTRVYKPAAALQYFYSISGFWLNMHGPAVLYAYARSYLARAMTDWPSVVFDQPLLDILAEAVFLGTRAAHYLYMHINMYIFYYV